MIAEIHGKISKSGSNLSEMMEDELTGNFFGQLRYITFNEGLKSILRNAVFPENVATLFDNIDVEFWNEKIEFWPYDSEGELDAYIEFDNVAIGIEVKYKSGLSSDDEVDYSRTDEKERLEESCNQLQRECRIIKRRAKDKTKILLLVGDALSCGNIYTNVNERRLLNETGVAFGYATWQSLLRELFKLRFKDKYSSLIISDLINLLQRKGFDQFNNMELSMTLPVVGDKYYKFDYAIKTGFSFETINKTIIKEGCYYDFNGKYT